MTLSLGMTFFPGRTVLAGMILSLGRALLLRTTGVFEKKEVLNNYMADGQRTTALAVYKASVEKKWGGVLACFINYFKYLLHCLSLATKSLTMCFVTLFFQNPGFPKTFHYPP